MLINRPHSAAMTVFCTINVFLSQSGINSWPGDTLHKFGAPDFQNIRKICRNYAQKKVRNAILCISAQILLGNYGI